MSGMYPPTLAGRACAPDGSWSSVAMKKRDYESPTRRPGSKAQLPQSVNTPTASSAHSQRKPRTTAIQAATLARREDRPSASSSPRQTASSSAPKTTKPLALQFKTQSRPEEHTAEPQAPIH